MKLSLGSLPKDLPSFSGGFAAHTLLPAAVTALLLVLALCGLMPTCICLHCAAATAVTIVQAPSETEEEAYCPPSHPSL